MGYSCVLGCSISTSMQFYKWSKQQIHEPRTSLKLASERPIPTRVTTNWNKRTNTGRRQAGRAEGIFLQGGLRFCGRRERGRTGKGFNPRPAKLRTRRRETHTGAGSGHGQQLHDIWHRTTVPTPHYAKCPEGRRAPFLFAPSVRKQTEDRCAFACSDFDSARLGQIHSTVLLF